MLCYRQTKNINKSKDINTFGDQSFTKSGITIIRSSNGSTLEDLLKEKERLINELNISEQDIINKLTKQGLKRYNELLNETK